VIRPPAPLGQLRDLELLLSANFPIIYLECDEEERAEALLGHVADHLDLLFLTWTPTTGLTHAIVDHPLAGTVEVGGCLDHMVHSSTEALYHMKGLLPLLQDDAILAKLRAVHHALWQHRGALMLTGPDASELPPEVARLAAVVKLAPPTELEYHQFLKDLLRDLRRRRPIHIGLDGRGVSRLIQAIRGLTFFEVQKVVTQAIAETWSLDERAIARIGAAKTESLRRTGVLEYTPAEQSLDDLAGLDRLKAWLQQRRPVFDDPARAKEFGLSPPRGILLLGVPGCGKSLSARAVAREYRLPLIRLDPARLYTKYVGETEQNLRSAITAAERMAPIVLWIDEIEKGLGQSGGDDSGVSQRVFGTFLQWMQDKPDGVFVIATCNSIDNLPPEMLRKGRFDEIFFVDLPDERVRNSILALHLARRGRKAAEYDLDRLAAASDGFSGSELEQAIVAALYAAYAEQKDLDTEHVAEAIASTRPLSVTSAEKIERLRSWAAGRTVPAV
jgi:SpoVK/Ycf46/Vps4 family AAA+-type ATPase